MQATTANDTKRTRTHRFVSPSILFGSLCLSFLVGFLKETKGFLIASWQAICCPGGSRKKPKWFVYRRSVYTYRVYITIISVIPCFSYGYD